MGRPLHDDLDRSQPREGREDGEGTGLIRVPDRAEGAKDNALGGRGQLLVGRGREGTTGLSQVVVGILGTRRPSWAVTNAHGTCTSHCIPHYYNVTVQCNTVH